MVLLWLALLLVVLVVLVLVLPPFPPLPRSINNMNQIRMPYHVITRFQAGDGHQTAVELEVRVQCWVDVLGVAGEGAVEDGVGRVVEEPGGGFGRAVFFFTFTSNGEGGGLLGMD